MRNFKPIFLTLFFTLILIENTRAFSLRSFFNFSSTTETKSEISKQENLQALKVFEPNKAYAETASPVQVNKNILKEDIVAFDADNNILKDAENIDENNNHSDNALYTVQKGDSIYSIASYFGVSVDTITSFNHMNSRTVHVGDVLEVPTVTGVMYKIKKGDTLNSISKKYVVEADDVSLYNGLISSDDLAIGDEIFLPGAKELETTKKATTKTTTKTTKTLAGAASKTVKVLRGDTSHLNTKGDIAKYSSLPKYSGYYTLPAPGTTRTQKMHGNNAVDLAGKTGLAVVASAGGTVRVAKNGGYNFGYGNYIIITHANGTETIYAHLLSADVSPGQVVGKGEQIGRLGSSGNSTGPHLHFEVRGAYNPFAW